MIDIMVGVSNLIQVANKLGWLIFNATVCVRNFVIEKIFWIVVYLLNLVPFGYKCEILWKFCSFNFYLVALKMDEKADDWICVMFYFSFCGCFLHRIQSLITKWRRWLIMLDLCFSYLLLFVGVWILAMEALTTYWWLCGLNGFGRTLLFYFFCW